MEPLKQFLAGLLLIAGLCLAACVGKSKCNAYCQNGGTCMNDQCVCPPGYIGANCENKDLCYGVTCQHNGVCNNGMCACAVGYEGRYCDTLSRDKFLGNWVVFEKGSMTLPAQYAVTIIPDTPGSVINVQIINFYNYFNTPIRAFVQRDSIIIPSQSYKGKVVFGYGYYSNNSSGTDPKITMRYEVIDSATSQINDFGYNSAVDHSNPSDWSK